FRDQTVADTEHVDAAYDAIITDETPQLDDTIAGDDGVFDLEFARRVGKAGLPRISQRGPTHDAGAHRSGPGRLEDAVIGHEIERGLEVMRVPCGGERDDGVDRSSECATVAHGARLYGRTTRPRPPRARRRGRRCPAR